MLYYRNRDNIYTFAMIAPSICFWVVCYKFMMNIYRKPCLTYRQRKFLVQFKDSKVL